MCGIAGYIKKEGVVNQATLTKMLKKLGPRGPDHCQMVHPLSSVYLGYTRFSIINYRYGNQPFLNEDKNITCFFNGEIYNWKEIKTWLNRRGHKLKGNCDGEVLPHLYEEYSLDFAKKLEGMYAIAINDKKNRRLLLTRDRVGEKPLYYSIGSNFFVFASDIKTLLASGLIKKDLDLQSAAEFFAFRCVPHTNTILKSVKKVEPGSTLVFNYENWELSTKVYWSPDIVQPQLISEEKAVMEFKKLLFDSVKLRTQVDEDLNLGTALSGGIDSSTITALSKYFLKEHTLHSFSVHVKDDPEDLEAIKKVVKKVKTDCHWVSCNTEDVKLLPFIVSIMGEPISAGMTIPSYQCYQEARKKNVRVLFTGDGSDELFAGYSGRLIMDGIIKRWNTLDANIRASYLRERPTLRKKLKSKLGNPNLSLLERYVTWDDDNAFDLDVRAKLLYKTVLSKFDPLVRLRPLEELTAGASHENGMLLLELKIRLEGFMLVILDRTSMACPVECRSPYLDSKIVNFAFKLAPELKFARGAEKYILRKTMEQTGLLPRQILWRKKHPFSGPISTWIDKLPLNLERLFSPKILDQYGLVNSKAVCQLYKDYKTGNLDKKTKINYSDLLFAVLVLTLWLEIFIQGRPIKDFMAE